jgi:hypothetical protein
MCVLYVYEQQGRKDLGGHKREHLNCGHFGMMKLTTFIHN